jgi:DNA helicase II / ATP-dependent DNA helicase PcrA
MELENLNESQKRAVLETEGPVMILAGAGSGKTRTLISRIQYLLTEKHISPYQILAVTFSNKAAREMRERLAQVTSYDIGTFQLTTFHAFCAKLLRMESAYLGLSKNFTIYDGGESLSIAKALLARHGISQKEMSPYEVLNYVEHLKNAGFYVGSDRHQEVELDPKLHPFFTEYEAELFKSNAVDFGGLLTGVVQLFHRFPDVLKKYQNKYKYILVDEYQDTNRAQFELINLLSSEHRNVCVVGDEDQSIYSWRGADIRNILDFEQIFPEVKLIKLEQNYRSSKTIIEAATVLISQNQERKGKTMWTENPHGDAILITECRDDRVEADFVTKEIKKIIDNGTSPQDIAVIYRNNSQSRVLEDALRKEKINYHIVAGIKFYERKEIKDMLSYMRVVVNRKDSLAFTRIINTPARGIGTTTLRKLEDEAIRLNLSLYEVVDHMIQHPQDFKHISLSTKVASSLRSLVHLINEVQVLETTTPQPTFSYEKLLHESGYLEFIKSDKSYEGASRLENLEELLSAIKYFEQENSDASLVKFLESVTLDSDDGETSQGWITLMTAHGSKGLEYPYIFLIGAEENLFPSFKSLEQGARGIEEERRLFYVAMTRAMKKLFITFAQSRMLWGTVRFNGPSTFLNELPKDKYLWKMEEGIQKQQWDDSPQMFPDYDGDAVFSEKTFYQSKSPAPKGKFPKGSKIQHALYGSGTVIDAEGLGDDEKVHIQFRDGVKKKFLVKFAPLELLK